MSYRKPQSAQQIRATKAKKREAREERKRSTLTFFLQGTEACVS